jgi:hypothetical protein
MIIATDTVAKASGIQLWGAFAFGLMLGWFLYFLNRYRKEVTLADLTTVIGAVGGAAILALFPAKTDLFGAYGIGLAIGFFGYFVVLLVLVAKSENFNVDFLIDGRRKSPVEPFAYGDKTDRAMLGNPDPGQDKLPKGT